MILIVVCCAVAASEHHPGIGPVPQPVVTGRAAYTGTLFRGEGQSVPCVCLCAASYFLFDLMNDQVLCAPYKPNAFNSFTRLLNTPFEVLKDCIQLMKLELVSLNATD
jgi:hypothetical protein